MQPQTEQILATLQVIIEPKSGFHLPGHEDGGYICPFVWDASQNGEFNILNLSRSQGWLKLTDTDATIKNWQTMDYANNFNSFSLNSSDKTAWADKIETLFQILSQSLQDMESFNVKTSSYFPENDSVGLIVGKTTDENWVAVCPTFYKETNIPQGQISRSPVIHSMSAQTLGENTLNLVSQLQAITSELGIIHLEGDLGGGYYYSYDYQIVYSAAETKELAIAQALQASGALEISQFQNFYPDKEYLQDWYRNSEAKYAKYDKLNKFLNHAFAKVMMYRFSFWTQENIYIIGETQCGDWAGLYIESEFVYNP
ncbi:nuclease A inhibitor family protein [Nostoc sp.]|uniref:nuclease A inhibitor family protein n=1 Tax=Nostoc sp. TaxID=1180 RepID=UPI002FF6BFE4